MLVVLVIVGFLLSIGFADALQVHVKRAPHKVSDNKVETTQTKVEKKFNPVQQTPNPIVESPQPPTTSGGNQTFLFDYYDGQVLFYGFYNPTNRTLNGEAVFAHNVSIRANANGFYTPYLGIPRFPGRMTIHFTNPYVANDTGWIGEGVFNDTSWSLWWVDNRSIIISGRTFNMPQ